MPVRALRLPEPQILGFSHQFCPKTINARKGVKTPSVPLPGIGTTALRPKTINARKGVKTKYTPYTRCRSTRKGPKTINARKGVKTDGHSIGKV